MNKYCRKNYSLIRGWSIDCFVSRSQMMWIGNTNMSNDSNSSNYQQQTRWEQKLYSKFQLCWPYARYYLANYKLLGLLNQWLFGWRVQCIPNHFSKFERFESHFDAATKKVQLNYTLNSRTNCPTHHSVFIHGEEMHAFRPCPFDGIHAESCIFILWTENWMSTVLFFR